MTHHDRITHFVLLAFGVALAVVGACLCCTSTLALASPETTPDGGQIHVSWMCIVPGVTCVFVGGLILTRLSSHRVDGAD